VAGQLVRCGTAAGPNYDEGCVGESRADFIHKIKIALKELVETRGWLKYIIIARLLPAKKVQLIRDECDELCKILTSLVVTAKQNASNAESLPISNRQSSIINRQ
jgi:four helix bundle protein